MQVLIIPSWYFPPGTHEIGGRMFHQFASGLKEQGIDARVLFAEFSPGAPFKKQISINAEEGIPTWRIRQWFPPKFNSTLIHLWIRKYVNAILTYIAKEGKPDLIHAQSYMAGFVCAEIHRKINIPFILTERVSSFIKGKIPIQHSPFIRDALNTATVISCVSPGLKSYLEHYTKQPIEVVPNYYDPLVFYYDPMIPKYNKFTWVSVGEPAHTKGLDLLLHAFSKVKQRYTGIDMQLILIDLIHEQKELMELNRQLDIENDITWTGLIPQVQVAGIMRQSHILISASRTETFGKAILEAQACGLPVIATKTDGATYILSTSEQGSLTDLNDVYALADAMSDMYLNYATYNPRSIIAAVELRFKKDIVIQQWKDLYNKIAT